MRIRTIKPEFWIHEGLCSLSEFTRLLAIALLNWSDDEGYFMANPAVLRGSLFPFLDDSKKIPRSLQELSGVGWIELGKDKSGREVGRVINFAKHQRVDKPKPSEIKASSVFLDSSKNDLGRVLDASKEEWKGKEEERKGKEHECFADVLSSASSRKPRAKSDFVDEPRFADADSAEFREVMAEWLDYKTQRRERYLEIGWQKLLAGQRQYSTAHVRASVAKSISNNWKGLFTDKITDSEAALHEVVITPPPSEPQETDDPDWLLKRWEQSKAKEAAEQAALCTPPDDIKEDSEWS